MEDSIRNILLAKGYRPYTLAADLGISWDIAKRILHGKTPLTLGDLVLISSRLQVPMNFMFDSPGAIAEREVAERQERERRRLANWKPYDFLNTLGGNHLFARDLQGGNCYKAARDKYNRFLEENSSNLTKDDIEAEAMRIAKEYLGEDFMERFREKRNAAEVSA